MRTLTVILIAALIAFAFVFSLAPPVKATLKDDKADRADAEMKKLAGIWEVESASLAGRPIPQKDEAVKMEFKGSIVTTVGTGTVRTINLDLSADPKRMTMTEAEMKNGIAVPKNNGEVNRAIYSLDGDTMTLVAGRGPKHEFPKFLLPNAADPVVVLKLKRVKN